MGGAGRGELGGSERPKGKVQAMWWVRRARCWFSVFLDTGGARLRTGRRAASDGLENPGSCGAELQGELDRFGGVSVHLSRHHTLHGLDVAAFRRLLQGKCGSRAPETRAERVSSERTPGGPLAVTWKCPQP